MDQGGVEIYQFKKIMNSLGNKNQSNIKETCRRDHTSRNLILDD